MGSFTTLHLISSSLLYIFDKADGLTSFFSGHVIKKVLTEELVAVEGETKLGDVKIISKTSKFW